MSIIDIDISYLLKKKITAQDFIIAYWIHFGTSGVQYLLEMFPMDKDSKERLIRANILENTEELKVTDEFKKKFDKNVYFYEFYEMFPIYTIRPSGQKEYLRLSPTNVKDRYNKIVKGNESIHKKIMKALKDELADRMQHGTMLYMKKMANWLNEEPWTAREEKEPIKIEEPGYGQSVE